MAVPVEQVGGIESLLTMVGGKVCSTRQGSLRSSRTTTNEAGTRPVLPAVALSAQTLPLMPWPASVHTTPGSVDINADFTMMVTGAGSADPRMKAAVQRTLVRLARQTGLPITWVERPRPLANRVTMQVVVERRDHKEPQRLGRRRKLLAPNLPAADIRLSADGPLGALRGSRNFPAVGPAKSVRRPRPASRSHTSTSAISPAFPWRGLSLDVSRHFIPVEEVERTIDGLAAVKLNVLHWHLSDDQGFRVESKKFPRLQESGLGRLLLHAGGSPRGGCLCARSRRPDCARIRHARPFHQLAARLIPSLASGAGPYNIVHEFGDPSGVIDPDQRIHLSVSRRLHRRDGKAVSRRILSHRRRRGQRESLDRRAAYPRVHESAPHR